MENHTDHPLTLTVEQAAKLLGIGRSTAYELVHTGDIPSLRLGRRIVVPTCQLAKQLGMDAPSVGAPATLSPDSIATPSTGAGSRTDQASDLETDQPRLF